MEKMTSVQRSKVPSFDVAVLNDRDGGSDTVLIAGGGGKMKSGVLNSIQVARGGQNGLEYETSHDTGVDLCNSLSSGICKSFDVHGEIEVQEEFVACGFSGECGVFRATRDGHKLCLTVVSRFQADFFDGPDGPDMKCSCFVDHPAATGQRDDVMHLVTGGEDGAIRLWECSKRARGDSTVNWVLGKHKGPIMTLDVQSSSSGDSRRRVMSASKDGSIAVWDVVKKSRVCQFSLTGAAAADASIPTHVECRSALFSPDGSSIFAIFSGKQSTFIAKFDSSEDEIRLAVVRKIAKVASTRMVANSTAEFIAVGIASGEVAVFRADSLSLVSKRQCHDFTITGLSFFRSTDCEEALVSVSVDSKVAVTRLDDLRSVVFQYAFRYLPLSYVSPGGVLGSRYIRGHLVMMLFFQMTLLILWTYLKGLK